MMNIQNTFNMWIDTILEHLKDNMRAFCFNIYEYKSRGKYSVELVGFDEFDEYDVDWASSGNETFASRDDNNEFVLSKIGDFEKCLDIVHGLILAYLQGGKLADKLKSAEKICYGFADGDLFDVGKE